MRRKKKKKKNRPQLEVHSKEQRAVQHGHGVGPFHPIPEDGHLSPLPSLDGNLPLETQFAMTFLPLNFIIQLI